MFTSKSRLNWFTMMLNNDGCPSNCSGHGYCEKGICSCEVQYSGGTCGESNLPYFISFSFIFYSLFLVTLVQLVLCVRSEFYKLKSTQSWREACKMTIQKLLYILVILAAATRAVYFSFQDLIPSDVISILSSTYYAILVSGCSLVVCFWAEVFHLKDRVSDTSPSFLSKSIFAFLMFNGIVYILPAVQFFTLYLGKESEFTNHIVDGCFAALMLFVVIFFIIYGVRVFFKVRSASLNLKQLHLSRLGMISQALMQIFTALFLVLNVTRDQWRERIPISGQNCYHIIFRVMELGVALWFPCTLWSWERPEQLWILNPENLVHNRIECEEGEVNETENLLRNRNYSSYAAIKDKEPRDCWICYDSETDSKLICPCNCKGDVGLVHHECLKKWLIEARNNNPAEMRCKVCNFKYQIKEGHWKFRHGLVTGEWILFCFVIFLLLAIPIATAFLCIVFDNNLLRIILIGLCVLLEFASLKYLGFSGTMVYNRARLSALRILNHDNLNYDNDGDGDNVVQ